MNDEPKRHVEQRPATMFGRTFYQVFVDGRVQMSRLTPFREDELRTVARIGPPTDPLAVREVPRPNTVMPTRPLADRREKWKGATDVEKTFDRIRWEMRRAGIQERVVERLELVVDNVAAVKK